MVEVFSRFAPFGRLILTQKSWNQAAAELQHYLENLGQSVAGSHKTQVQIKAAITGTVNYIPKWITADSFGNSHIFDDGYVITATSPTSFVGAPTTDPYPSTFYAANQYSGSAVTAQHPALYNGVPGNNYISGVAALRGQAFGINAGTNIGAFGYAQNGGTGDAVGGLFMAPFFLGSVTGVAAGVIAKGGNPGVGVAVGGAFGLGSTEAILLEDAVIIGDTCHSFNVPLLLLKHAGVELASIRPVTDGVTSFLNVTGTLSTTPSAAAFASKLIFTSAGSAAQIQVGMQLSLLAGYTGGSATYTASILNTAAGTAVGELVGSANYAVVGAAAGVTAGVNVGGWFRGYGSSNRSYGLIGVGNENGSSTGDVVGILGIGQTTGSPTHVIGIAAILGNSLPTYVTTAFLADNQGSGKPIGIFRANGTEVVSINITAADNSTNFLKVTGTLPSAPSATVMGANIQITGAGSTAQAQQGVNVKLNAGYTGASFNAALLGDNATAGTGTSPFTPAMNIGLYGRANGTTTGTDVGTYGNAGNGDLNYGVFGSSFTSKANASNIGVAGYAINAGSNGVPIGGLFALKNSAVTLYSAALAADNGTITAPIILAADNNTKVWSIEDNGSQWAARTKDLTESTATLFCHILTTNNTSIGGLLDYVIEANDGTDYQSRAGTIAWSVVNKGGTLTMTIGTPDGASEVVAASAGTLTNTFTLVDGGTGTLQFKANAVSSLTQTTLKINYFVKQRSGAAYQFVPD